MSTQPVNCLHSNFSFFYEEANNASMWMGRIITVLTHVEDDLETIFPNYWIQNQLDDWGERLKNRLDPLVDFSSWLHTNGGDQWYEQMALFLRNMPVHIAHNIVNTLYDVVKTILTCGVHPLKGLIMAAKYLVDMFEILVNIQRWPEAGAGTIGSTIAQGFSGYRHYSMLFFAIGGALIVMGLTHGQLEAALNSVDGSELLLRQIQSMPSAFTAGIASGYTYAYIRR